MSVIGGGAVLVAVVVLVALLAPGPSKARVASSGARVAKAGHADAFSWLHPETAPAAWLKATTPTSGATLFYPRGWRPIAGDRGTVSVSLRTHESLYAGYLNVTPRQGAETLRGWAAFRISHNREEGDGHEREVAAADGLHFRSANGACVIDDYTSRVGSHAYREIACLVKGDRHADVFIGAALRSNWGKLAGTLERAASSFVQR